jgi:hypothetical protein
MTKRTIKAAAGDSRVSAKDAKSAARYVYRDGTTGRFVIVRPAPQRANAKKR